jgi:mevalonate kinase
MPAIAAGIDRGARAVATALTYGPSRLCVGSWGLAVTDGGEHDLARAYTALLDATRATHRALGAFDVEVDVSVPPGAGLGCSAAVGVAVARAVDPRASDVAIQERVMAWERVFHGNPSGIDAAVAARGGCYLYRKGAGLELLHIRAPLVFCIGNTGAASSTKAMVESVARLRARRPKLVDESLQAIRTLVQNARLALEAGDRTALGRLMDLNQMLLSGLFVSTSEIERMCGLARDHGAHGAKLTGAGGGGSVLALAPSADVGEAILSAWRTAGFDGFSTRVAAESPEPSLERDSAP